MGRWRGKTTERGYGSPHAKLRAQWKPQVDAGRVYCHATVCLEFRDGNSRLIIPGTPWHLGHTTDRTGWTGPEHERCGAADGARRGNQARQFVPAAGGSNVICPACGKPYHYAARSCEMCGSHYHPTYGQQRTCSRACGAELQRRNRMAAGWVPRDQRPKPPPKPKPPPHLCEICGQACPTRYQRTCSYQCGNELKRRNMNTPYTCRYCGRTGVTKDAPPGRGLREVCAARECQMARRAANNLRVRNGLTKEEADEQVRALLGTGSLPGPGRPEYGRWQQSRRW